MFHLFVLLLFLFCHLHLVTHAVLHHTTSHITNTSQQIRSPTYDQLECSETRGKILVVTWLSQIESWYNNTCVYYIAWKIMTSLVQMILTKDLKFCRKNLPILWCSATWTLDLDIVCNNYHPTIWDYHCFTSTETIDTCITYWLKRWHLEQSICGKLRTHSYLHHHNFIIKHRSMLCYFVFLGKILTRTSISTPLWHTAAHYLRTNC